MTSSVLLKGNKAFSPTTSPFAPLIFLFYMIIYEENTRRSWFYKKKLVALQPEIVNKNNNKYI